MNQNMCRFDIINAMTDGTGKTKEIELSVTP